MLNNPTSETLHYQIKWGDQAWENFDVGPGQGGTPTMSSLVPIRRFRCRWCGSTA